MVPIAAEYEIPFPPWLLAAGAAVLVTLALLLVRYVVRRGGTYDPDALLVEDLAELLPAPPAGTHRLMFEGWPVRLRLVVIAPAGRNTELAEEMPPGLLQAVVHGLGQVAELDDARVTIWPGQLSQEGFAPKFFRNIYRPEPAGDPSPWILVAGPARSGAKTILIGLALEMAEPTMRGNVRLKPEQWNDKFRVSVVGEPRP